MSHPTLDLFDAAAGVQARPLAALRTELLAVAARGATWVVLAGPEPDAHPDVAEVIAAATAEGLGVKMESGGAALARPGAVQALRDAGLRQLILVFRGGSPATHDGSAGQPGAFATAVEALDIAARVNGLHVTARLLVHADSVGEVAAWVTRVREPAQRLELVHSATPGPPVSRRDLADAFLEGWRAARVFHRPLSTFGFVTWPAPPRPGEGPPEPVDGTLLDALWQGVPVPSAAAGTWATPQDADLAGLFEAEKRAGSLHDLGLALAALGAPALDLPPSMGGHAAERHPDLPADAPTPLRRRGLPALLATAFRSADARPLPAWTGIGAGARAVVVGSGGTDNLLSLSTLPGLTAALQAAGVTARLESAWHAPHDPDGPPPPMSPLPRPRADGSPGVDGATLEAFTVTAPRIAAERARRDAFWAGLDLADADLVVVSGYDNAARALSHPTLRADARVEVADLHLLAAVETLPRPWPGERVTVRALFPRSVRAYVRAGVPLRQVLWRPYPIHRPHLQEGPPPSACETVFAGGAHQRDWQTLARAVASLGRDVAQRVALYTPDPVPPPLVSLGDARLLAFHAALAASRVVVLPLVADLRRPAGISVLSMALAAGRPIVATATAATVDHLRDGVDALLVPPRNARRLAEALDAVLRDDALADRLGRGARAAAAALDTARWAEELVHGAPPATTWPDTPTGPWRPWPRARQEAP